MSLQAFIYSLNVYLIIVRAMFKRQIKTITFKMLMDTKKELGSMLYHDLPSPLPYNIIVRDEFLEQGCSCAVLDA